MSNFAILLAVLKRCQNKKIVFLESVVCVDTQWADLGEEDSEVDVQCITLLFHFPVAQCLTLQTFKRCLCSLDS